MSSCLGRAAVPVKRVWRGLSSRLAHHRRRRTRTAGNNKLSTQYVPVSPDHHDEVDDDGGVGVLVGLGRLRKDVRSCEYHDVHVMWEMLSAAGDSGRAPPPIGRSRDHMDDGVGAGNGAPPAKARRKAAPWRRLVAYCCAF